jgi:hypothetical protein
MTALFTRETGYLKISCDKETRIIIEMRESRACQEKVTTLASQENTDKHPTGNTERDRHMKG